MPMVRAMRLLNAVEAGTTTGAQLQTLLTADPGRLAELNVLLGMRGQARRMAASSTAMNAVAASSTARLAVFNSDSALTAIGSSAVAKTALRAAAGYTIKSVGNSTSETSIGLTGNVIMVGFSSSNANGYTAIAGRRAGSTVGSLIIVAAQTPVNNSASYDNVMALTSAATTINSWSTTTHYFGVLPV